MKLSVIISILPSLANLAAAGYAPDYVNDITLEERERALSLRGHIAKRSPSNGLPGLHEAVCERFYQAGMRVGRYMVDERGRCNGNARQAIRIAFHDCFGDECNGSLILSDECTTRRENQKLIPACQYTKTAAGEYDVHVSDLIQFSAALGVAFCLGPPLTFVAGRTDSSTASKHGMIPGPNASKDGIMSSFINRGFTERDVVALMGAHSAGKNMTDHAFDSTPDTLDVRFYQETLNGNVPAFIRSDQMLLQSGSTADIWREFAGDQFGWNDAFAAAMAKMGDSGWVQGDLRFDCTSTVPEVVRDVRNRM